MKPERASVDASQNRVVSTSRRRHRRLALGAAALISVAVIVVLVLVLTGGTSKPFDPENVPVVLTDWVGDGSNLPNSLINCSYDHGLGGGIYQYSCTTYTNKFNKANGTYFQHITLNYDTNIDDVKDSTYICTNPELQGFYNNEAKAPSCSS